MKMFRTCWLIAGILSLASASVARQPNFLFILADDQSPFDLKLYNPASVLDTPNIDRLAAEGMIFDGAHHLGSWSGAVCTPSRSMIMTGRSVWHLPNYKEAAEPSPADINEFTLPVMFNRAGYATMRTCKKGNSYEPANKRFTVREDAKKRGGTEETGSAWHGNRVLEYLSEREKSGDAKPFFIFYGFSHPHDPRNGTEPLLRKYGATNHDDEQHRPPKLNPERPAPKLPVNYLPEHPFHHGHVKLRDEERVMGVWKNRDEATIRNEVGREFACSENIDIQIGKVLDKLEAMGELDNTYIIYTADHGMAIGRHGLTGKQNLYEHTWRVPYIVKGPTVKKGVRVTGNIYLLDTLKTLLDLAGIEPSEYTEGISFRPVLEGEKDAVRDTLYGVYCGGSKPGMRSVKKGKWKLIKYDVLDGSVRETQLFNLDENPHEYLAEHQDPAVVDLLGIKPGKDQVNLADDPKYAKKRQEMEALLLEQMKLYDDPYRLWDQSDM